MAEEEKKPGWADNRKKKLYGRFAKGAAGRSTYKSKVMLGHQATLQSLASC
jgi:hypothetical protein